MNGFKPFNTVPNAARDVSPGPGLLSPIPQGVRRVSGDTTPTVGRQIINGGIPSSAGGMSSPGTENEVPAPWSSAVGHATTAGKSGRVIERLMAENDKFKRELELQVLRVQELERNAQTYKPQMEAMREKIDSLSHVKDMDSSILKRRDRKIEELKTDLVHEREGKAALQRRLREAERERDETAEQKQREMQGLAESTKHATVHAEILETSHKQLSAEYRARYEALRKSFDTLLDERDYDRQKLARLEVVCEQMRTDHERTRRLQAELVARWEECERGISGTVQEAEESNDRVRKKSVEMDRVVDEMRWLMGVKKNANVRNDSPTEDGGVAAGPPLS